jgi:hypothetical protein
MLRDGLAFVSYLDGTLQNESVKGLLAFYASTIYVDTMLLANIQARWINDLADLLADYGEAGSNRIGELSEIERGLTRFRATVWWRSVAQGSHGDRLLRAYQGQHELGDLFASSASEMSDLTRQASTELDQRSLEAARRTNQTVTLLTVVGVPLGIVFSLWQGLGGGWTRLLVCFVLFVAISVLLAGILVILHHRRRMRGRGPLLRGLLDLGEPIRGDRTSPDE